MTHYLLESGPFPFKAQSIRRSLGLRTGALDLLIEAGITSICLMSRKPVRTEVWAVTVDDDPTTYGVPVSISEPYTIPSDRRQVRRVEFAPNMLARVAARRNVLAWCRNQLDIGEALAAELNAPAEPLAEVAA